MGVGSKVAHSVAKRVLPANSKAWFRWIDIRTELEKSRDEEVVAFSKLHGPHASG